MRVTQLIGQQAGEEIEMGVTDAVAAHKSGTVKINDVFILMRYDLLPAQMPKKRHGGWPKGKARGPRKPRARA